jgi:TolB-like protein
MTYHSLHKKLLGVAIIAASAVVAAQQPPPAAQPPQQPNTVGITISGDAGAQTRLAVPDLLALSSDRETQDAAKVISEVLWNDLNFEREFYMIPRDTYKSIPVAPTIDALPYDRWRELGADGVIIGTVQRVATGIRVELRLYNVRARQSIFGREYTGSAANPRIRAYDVGRSARLAAQVARCRENQALVRV